MAHGLCTPPVLRVVLVIVGVCLIGYTIKPPLFWSFKETSIAPESCPPCVCDCSSEDFFPIPSGFPNGSLADCGKDDSGFLEEMQKDLTTLTHEELDLQKIVAHETLEHTKVLINDAKIASSHYQREIDKCNAAVETCEEARESLGFLLCGRNELVILGGNMT
ncbi:hypothetical protein UlMin_029315 [Ulmus minor]